MALNKDFIVKNGLVVLAQGSANSTSTTTGAAIIHGGVGIGGDVNIAGGLFASGVDFLAHDPQIYYVADHDFAKDTNDGARPQSPFRTLKHALTIAGAGDTVYLEPGTYQEEFPLTIPQGVSVRGAGLRECYVHPTVATQNNDAFYLNSETTISDFTVGGFYKPGWAFKFAPGAKVTSRSPYIERFSVLTRGSSITQSDPYGFLAGDAGNGAYIDGAAVTSDSQYATFLFNEATFIVPNATGVYMTNGARSELLNGFVYFADTAIHAVTGNSGFAGQGQTRLRLGNITGVFSASDTLYYYSSTGTVLASAVIDRVDDDYIYINGPAWGFQTYVEASTSTQSVFSTGTSAATATQILLADYHQFGAELRCIGSAAVFGNSGVIADGTGTDLKLIAFNMSHVGAGGDLSDDTSLVTQATEVIQTNGGHIYYQTVDQSGDFRVGSQFVINQRTGNVSFGTATINLASLPSLDVTDGVYHTLIQPTSISVGNLSLSGNSLASVSGNLTLNSSGPAIILNKDTRIQGAFTATGISKFTNSQNATSTLTGAVQVSGGLSTVKDVWVGGNLNVVDPNTSATIANLYVTGNAFIPGGFTATSFTSTELTVVGATALQQLTAELSTLTKLTVVEDASVGGNFYVTGTSYISNIYGTTASFTSLVLSDTTNSNSTVTGALIVAGGVGIGKNLHVGGDTYLKGNLYVDGISITVDSTTITVPDKLIIVSSSATTAAVASNSGIQVGTGTGFASLLFDGTNAWKSKGSIVPNGTWNLGGLTNPWNVLYANSVFDNSNRVVTSVGPSAGLGIGILNLSAYGPAPTFVVTNTGVLSVTAGTDTAVSQATGNVTIWNTATLQTVTSRGGATDRAIQFTNLSPATSRTTGSVVISGGLAVGGNLHVGTVISNGAEAWTTATLTDNSQLGNGAGYLTSSTIGLFGVSAIQAGVGIDVSAHTGTVTVTNIGVVSLKGSQYIGISASSGSNITLTNLGVQQISTGSGISVNVSTGNVVVSSVDTLQLVTQRGNTTNQTIAITATNLSVTTNSGQALLVSGGIGALAVFASIVYDSGNRVLTKVYPTAGTAISIGSVSTSNGSTTFTINNTGVTAAAGTTYLGVSAATGAITFTNLGVQTLSAGTDTSVSQSTGTVIVWNNSTLQSITNRGSITNNAIAISNVTQTTSTDTGALTVVGGVGINKNLYVGGDVQIIGQLNADVVVGSITTASNIFGGATGDILYQEATGATKFIGIGAANTFLRSNGTTATWQTTASMHVAAAQFAVTSTNLVNGYIQNASQVTITGLTTITNTTLASSTITGALVVAGGIGAANVYASSIFDNNLRVVTSVTPSAGTGIGISNAVTNGPAASFAITNLGVTNAAGTAYLGVSASTGSVTFTNLGVQTLSAGTDTRVSASTGTITVWDASTLQSVTGRGATTPTAISITNATDSTTTATGSLIVTGGAGFGKNVNIGGSMNVWGPAAFKDTVTFSGSATYVYSTNTIYTDNMIELHTTATGVNSEWTFDDLKDIGFRLHYFNRAINSGTNAFLGMASDTQWLEWYDTGVETTGSIFASATYGSFKTGKIQLVNTTDSSSVGTGAFVVAGGAGIGKKLYVGDAIYSNGSLVVTAANLGQFGVAQLVAGPAIGVSPSYGTGTVTITNLGVQNVAAGSGIAVSTSTGSVTISSIDTLQLVTARGATTNQPIAITATNLSSTTSTGQALLVSGGIGALAVYAENLFDQGKRVVTGVIPTAGSGISVTSVTTSGPTAQMTINNTGVLSAIGTTYLGVSAATGNVTFTNLGVQTLTAGTDTAVSQSTGTVTVWSTATLQSITNRGSATTNAVNIQNTTQSTSTLTGALIVAGGVGIGKNVNIFGDLNVSGMITGFASVAGSITTASNIAFGTAGALPYQVAAGVTGFIGIGAANTFLRSNGSTATWQTTASIYVNSAVYAEDLRLGAPGAIPYQTAANTTDFIGIGSGGSLLQSNGSTATWQTTATIYVNSSVYTENVRGGATGQLLYQSNGSVTSFVGPGTAGNLLVSNGSAAPAYVNTLTLAGTVQAVSTMSGTLQVRGGVGIGGNLYVAGTVFAANVQGSINTATNIAGGSLGQIPYQTGPGITNFFGPGTAGNVLVSNGAGAPSYNNTLVLSGTTPALSTQTGALQVRGGLGVGGNIYAGGSLYAVTKSFLIDHPTKPGKKLRYGSLEGPENGVYVRGRLTGSNTIELPDYWTKLVDPDSITVDLTPIGQHQKLYVKEIVNNTIVVGNENLFKKEVNCFYTVWAERADVAKLDVEGE